MTKIEWCDTSWNPVTGCTPISAGCEHCYAARMAKRLAGRFGYPKDDPFRPGTLHETAIEWPKFRRGQRVFVCSMGDLFHPMVPPASLERLFALMDAFNGNTFILLTKRPRRMAEFLKWWWDGQPYERHRHYWVGATVENQAAADERIPILLDIPAAVRFVSIEPMLGPVHLFDAERDYLGNLGRPGATPVQRGLDWVICGAETGPGKRAFDPAWAVDLAEQCAAANVPFFFKKDYQGLPELAGRIIRQFPSP